jgi:hypothetical protein
MKPGPMNVAYLRRIFEALTGSPRRAMHQSLIVLLAFLAFAMWLRSALVVASAFKASGFWFQPSGWMGSTREGQFMAVGELSHTSYEESQERCINGQRSEYTRWLEHPDVAAPRVSRFANA